jgi:hypothetical protein
VPSSNQARSFAWDIAEEAFRVLKSGGRMVVTSEEPGGHSRLLRNLGLKEESLDPVAEKRFREMLRGTLTRDPYDSVQDFEGIVGNCPGDMLLLTDTILGKLILDNMHCEFFWLPDAVNVGVKP